MCIPSLNVVMLRLSSREVAGSRVPLPVMRNTHAAAATASSMSLSGGTASSGTVRYFAARAAAALPSAPRARAACASLVRASSCHKQASPSAGTTCSHRVPSAFTARHRTGVTGTSGDRSRGASGRWLIPTSLPAASPPDEGGGITSTARAAPVGSAAVQPRRTRQGSGPSRRRCRHGGRWCRRRAARSTSVPSHAGARPGGGPAAP